MATFEINYKSDFTLVMGFTLAGVAVPLPVGNFRIVFRTQEYGTEYECSRINGEYVNCKDNGNDTLLCIFDRHGLRPGALRGEVFDYIPDTTFPDGSQLVVTPSLFDIELVEGAGNTSEGVTAEVVISVEEVVGQARDAARTAENAAESANAAAGSASDAAGRANDAAAAATEAAADIDEKIATKQDKLVSGTNIKTINGESVLGAGNIAIEARNVLVVPVRYTGSRYVPNVSYDVAVAYINAGGTVAYVVGGVVYIATTIYTNEIVGVAINSAGTAKKVSHYFNVSGDIFTLNNQPLNSSISITQTLPDSVASATGNPVSDRAVIIALQSYARKRTYVDNSADASVQLSVTTYNDLGTLSSWKTITLPASYDRADEFVFRFECGDASLSPALPAGVVLADGFDFSETAVGVVFQVSIMDGIAAYLCLTPNA